MSNRDKYWRSEYENLRRKKNKEIADLKEKQARFAWRTYDLLRLAGLRHEDIMTFYRGGKNDNDRI